MHQPVGELPQLRFEIIEAARILRMSRATLYERIRAGEIKAQKMAGEGTSRPLSCSGTFWRRIDLSCRSCAANSTRVPELIASANEEKTCKAQ